MPPAAVVRRLFGARSRLKRGADRLFPASVVVVDRMFAAGEVKLLGLVCDVGLPDLLNDRRATSRALSDELDLDPDATERVLRFLASRGWFTRHDGDGTYELNARSRLLRSDDPESLRDWARFMAADWHWDMWNHVGDALATGGSAATSATGKDFFAWTHEDRPDAGEVFDGAMKSLSSLAGPLLAATIDLEGVGSICDVGGGTGRTLAALLASASSTNGTLFDIPEVVASAGDVLDPVAAGRWEAVGGDFFDSVPRSHDRYILQGVLHDWDDERAGRILTNILSAMPPNGRVHVVDQILDPSERDGIAAAVDVLMLALAEGGRERTTAEWEDLFLRNGFRVVDRKQLPILIWVTTLERAA